MKLLSKKPGQKPPLKQKLQFKIASLRQISTLQESPISYVDAQYILNNKKIKQSLITIFLGNIYGQKWEVVNREWKQALSETKILEDLYVMKRKMIQEQWISENKSQQRIQEKEIEFQGYLDKIKVKEDLQYRLKALRNDMDLIGTEIDMAKKDAEVSFLKDKYDKIKRQYTFLTNKKRRMKELAEEKKTIDLAAASNMNHLEKLVEEKSLEKERKKYVEVLTKNIEANTSKRKQSGQKRIKKLEDIFDRYAGTEPNSKMLFEEIVSAKKSISLETLLKMLGETEITSLLTNEEKVKIIKEHSKYNRKIDFNSFVDILKAICQKNSEKLYIEFTSQALDMFLDEFISKVQSKKSRLNHYSQFIPDQNKHKQNSISNELSKYRYQLIIHSGKYEQSMEQELLERKNSKKAQLTSIKERSATLDYKTKHSTTVKVREDKKLNSKQTGFTPKKHLVSQPPERTYYQHELSTSKMPSKLSYAMIFQKRKLSEGNNKRYNTENSVPYREPLQIKQPKRTSEKSYNSIDVSSQNSYSKETPQSTAHRIRTVGLENIIDEEDDPFLTNHLQKKSMLVGQDESPRKIKRIHF